MSADVREMRETVNDMSGTLTFVKELLLRTQADTRSGTSTGTPGSRTRRRVEDLPFEGGERHVRHRGNPSVVII